MLWRDLFYFKKIPPIFRPEPIHIQMSYKHENIRHTLLYKLTKLGHAGNTKLPSKLPVESERVEKVYKAAHIHPYIYTSD